MKSLLIYFVFSLIFYSGQCCRTSNFFPEGGARALAIMRGTSQNSTILGTIRFDQASESDPIKITVNMNGIPKGIGPKHGLHIHQSALTDLSDSTATVCGSAGPHFNPFNITHGDIKSETRHLGDLGNVVSDSNGNVAANFTDNNIKLFGPFGILGRTVVLHQNEDDLGLKNDIGSKTFGNSGPRIACGVIGLLP